MDKSGEVLIEPQFEKVDWFQCGLAQFYLNNKMGFINTKGQPVIEAQFSTAYPFTEDALAAVAQGITVDEDGIIHDEHARWGFIDTQGNLVIDMNFKEVFPFSEGWAAVQALESEKFGFINKRGEMLIPAEYDWCTPFREGLAAVKKEGLWGFIDVNGSVVIDFQFDEASNDGFEDGITQVNGTDYIDRKGHFIWQALSINKEDSHDEQELSPEEYLVSLAAEMKMDIEEYKAYIKKQAIEMELLSEKDEWFDNMPENDLLEWMVESKILQD